MNPRSKIIGVLKNIELQQEAIEDLHQIKKERKITDIKPDEDIEIISTNLENYLKTIKKLQIGYNHRMISRMVSGIKDEEMMAWWMNRY